MFEQTFVQGAGEVRKPWPVAASFAGQMVLVGIALTVPLVQTAKIAWTPPMVLYLPPRTEPQPVKVQASSPAQTVASAVRAVFQPRFTAPTHVPATISTIGDDPPPAAFGNAMEPFGIATGQVLPFSPALAPPKPAAEPAAVKPKPTSIRASLGVQQALLIYQVKPEYPALARQARISGTVRMAAIIARDGTIQHLQLISGPPLLVKAALEAVQKWRYKPTLLSGEPVEVITEIDVNFTLSN